MTKGAVTISIDLELAWGNWDDITGDQIKLVERHERQSSRGSSKYSSGTKCR